MDPRVIRAWLQHPPPFFNSAERRKLDDLDTHPTQIYVFVERDTCSIRDLQRETAAAIRAAESGTLVTVTRHDRPVVHVISAARLDGILETMELLADADFTRRFRLLRAGKLKFHPAASLAD